jgi:CheY-like chemotaxis protein
MPEMDGENLALTIIADSTLSDTSLVLLTSLPNSDDSVRLEEIGLAGYLVKPAQSDLLREVLSAVWSARSSGIKSRTIVTSHPVAELRSAAAADAVGMDDYVSKPVSRQELQRVLAQWGRKQAETVSQATSTP